MSTQTHQNKLGHPTQPSAARASFVPTGSGLSFIGLLRSESIKMWSLRSTVWSFSLVIVLSLGMAALMSTTIGLEGAPALDKEMQEGIVLQASTIGLAFGQLIVAVLGVLVISGEYSTGMIKSTLAATPRRLPMLWAKAVVLFVSTFVVGAIAILTSFVLAAAVLAGKGVEASLFSSDVLLPMLANVFFLGVVAVFALALGTIVRSSAGGIAAVLGILLILPIVLSVLGAMQIEWAVDVVPFLLDSAGADLAGAQTKKVWENLLIMAGWLVPSVGIAAVLLKRRDA